MSHDAVFKRYCREGVTEKMTRASYWAQVLIGGPFVGPENAEEFAALAQEEMDRKHGAKLRRGGRTDKTRVTPKPSPEPDVDPDDDDPDDDDPQPEDGMCTRCGGQSRPGAKACRWCTAPLSAADAGVIATANATSYIEPLVLAREPERR